MRRRVGMRWFADVAPTVAALLGIKLDNTDGRVLQEILEARSP